MRILLWGMSCSGKTTFAKRFKDYLSFDALFPWYTIETLNLSITAGLEYVRDSCPDNFVLDGWHISDKEGKLFPRDVTVCIIFASYERIIKQYRDTVEYFDMHRHMFNKWYDVKFKARYFKNAGEFIETDLATFQSTCL